MTSATRIACLSLLVALAAAACDPSGPCPCPSGGATVTLPVTQSVSIESVSSDPPCSAAILSEGHVLVGRPDTGRCLVTARLTNGDTYTVDIEFRVSGNGCCGHVPFVVNTPVPQLVDAGASD